MPVELDWVTVRLVGDVAPIAIFPLTTVAPVGSDCAIDACVKPIPDKSAITLTETRSSLLRNFRFDERPDEDETVNRTTMY